MAEANGGAAPPAAQSADDGATSTPGAARKLPTPEEMLATFETLSKEHKEEREKIDNLTAQLKGLAISSDFAAPNARTGQMALMMLADETKLHLNQYLVSSKAVPTGLVGPQLMITMRKKLWDSALVLQNGGLHKQAAEIFVALLPEVVSAYTDTEPMRLADAYLQTAKSLTALDILPRAQQLVDMAVEIEKNARRDIVKAKLGLCTNQGCSKKGAMKCSACNKEGYCSKECQKADWRRRHKVLCTGKQ